MNVCLIQKKKKTKLWLLYFQARQNFWLLMMHRHRYWNSCHDISLSSTKTLAHQVMLLLDFPMNYVSNQTQVQFSKLSSTEKSYALVADNIRSQAKKFKNIVAVLDASNLAGLRRHWRTCVHQEVKNTRSFQALST